MPQTLRASKLLFGRRLQMLRLVLTNGVLGVPSIRLKRQQTDMEVVGSLFMALSWLREKDCVYPCKLWKYGTLRALLKSVNNLRFPRSNRQIWGMNLSLIDKMYVNDLFGDRGGTVGILASSCMSNPVYVAIVLSDYKKYFSLSLCIPRSWENWKVVETESLGGGDVHTIPCWWPPKN